ncbi:hypothetical protein GCM10023235_15280 [Kitasatospora terrestris]|uniref:Uncharacterized protein n=1 Tax=Kitasatospora terrestris TaxID=258051 RepID=A0ABP9DE29_9ACTN
MVEPTQGTLAAGVFLMVVSVVSFIWGAAAGHWFSHDPVGAPSLYGSWPIVESTRPDYAFLGWISGLALVAAVVVLLRASVLSSDRRRLLAGRENAERLWSQGWYCRRCGCVHFRAERGRESRALTLPEFRAMVWEAGGYADS